MSRAVAMTMRRACLASAPRATPRVISIPATRSFRTTTTLMKKNRKSIETEEAYEDPESEETIDEEDLFASSSSSATHIRDPSAQLQPLLAQIQDIMALPTEERRAAFSHTKVGVLRRVVQLYPTEEVEGLKGVLRSWRSLGGRVTRKTAEELVGRLCNLGRTDLALELLNDRTQYGLPPLPTHSQTRLHHTLLTTPTSSNTVPVLSPGIPISKTLATLHLALRQKASQDPITQSELSRLVSQIKRVKIEVKDSEEMRREARGGLERAGGLWADAAKRIEGAAVA